MMILAARQAARGQGRRAGPQLLIPGQAWQNKNPRNGLEIQMLAIGLKSIKLPDVSDAFMA